MTTPIKLHPENPKVLEFRGKPFVLVTATEHYGAVMNRPFDIDKYLHDAAEKGMTVTRLFTLFRELQGPNNPYSTCKPESTDYVAPFVRTGPGIAGDCQLKYDLDQWNPEFTKRLHHFLGLASELGIVVEMTVLSNTYCDAVWALNPLNPANNINGLPAMHWPEYMSLRHPELFARQAAYVKRMVQETQGYDNLMYEICNEPGGALTHEAGVTTGEVNEWQIAIAKVIRENDPAGHMVVGQEAFHWVPFEQKSTYSFKELPIDMVNMHPLPNTTFEDVSYHMGDFMMKQLKIRDMQNYCLATYDQPKPLNYDEDNAASQFREPEGWTIHRKRAWTSVISGAHYDVIDFSIIPGFEAGTKASRKGIRQWLGILGKVINSIPLVEARPLPGIVLSMPEHLLASAMVTQGKHALIYLADERELGVEGAGCEISGECVILCPEGDVLVRLLSPETGMYSPWISAHSDGEPNGDGELRLTLPAFCQDIAIEVVKLA